MVSFMALHCKWNYKGDRASLHYNTRSSIYRTGVLWLTPEHSAVYVLLVEEPLLSTRSGFTLSLRGYIHQMQTRIFQLLKQRFLITCAKFTVEFLSVHEGHIYTSTVWIPTKAIIMNLLRKLFNASAALLWSSSSSFSAVEYINSSSCLQK